MKRSGRQAKARAGGRRGRCYAGFVSIKFPDRLDGVTIAQPPESVNMTIENIPGERPLLAQITFSLRESRFLCVKRIFTGK
jgi:hypothetical protein